MAGVERINLFGRGAEPRFVTHDQVVAAAPIDVWNLLTDVSRIAEWWPRATTGEVVEGEETGRRQRILLDWGRQTGMTEQVVTHWDRPRLYGWHVAREVSTTKGELPPLADVQVTIEIVPQGPISLVRITGEFRPASIGRIPAIRELSRQAKATYRKALKRLEQALVNRR